MPGDVVATLRSAVRQLEAERKRIDRQVAAIRSVLGAGRKKAADGVRPRRRRRRMSAAARRAVGQRMKGVLGEAEGGAPRGGARMSQIAVIESPGPSSVECPG